MYLDNRTLINFSLSTNLIASWPQIGQHGIRLGTLMGSFRKQSTLVFHNWIGVPSVKLQTLSVGEILYCIIGQLDESTNFLKRCILVGQSKINNTKNVDVSTLTLHLSYNYHKVASN
jgi:hypothetical protein